MISPRTQLYTICVSIYVVGFMAISLNTKYYS